MTDTSGVIQQITSNPNHYSLRNRHIAAKRFVADGSGFKFKTWPAIDPKSSGSEGFWADFKNYVWCTLDHTNDFMDGVKAVRTPNTFEKITKGKQILLVPVYHAEYDDSRRPKSYLASLAIKLLTNPLAIGSGLLAGLHYLTTTFFWLTKTGISRLKASNPTSRLGQIGKYAGMFACGFANLFLATPLKLLTGVLSCAWKFTVGSIGSMINRYQRQGMNLDTKGQAHKRTGWKRAKYIIGAAALSLISWSLVCFPVAGLLAKIKPIGSAIHKIQSWGRSIHNFFGKNTKAESVDRSLKLSSLYGMKNMGATIAAAPLVAGATATMATLNTGKYGMNKLKGVKTKRLGDAKLEAYYDITNIKETDITTHSELKHATIIDNDAILSEELPSGVKAFNAKWTEVKKDFNETKQKHPIGVWALYAVRILTNPALMVGLLLGGLYKGLVAARQKCQGNTPGSVFWFSTFGKIDKYFAPMVFQFWKNTLGPYQRGIDALWKTAMNDRNTVLKRIGASIGAILLGALSWTFALSAFINPLHRFAHKLKVMSAIEKAGRWFDKTITGFSTKGSGAFIATLRFFKVLIIEPVGLAVEKSAKYCWGFIATGLIGRAINRLFGAKGASTQKVTDGKGQYTAVKTGSSISTSGSSPSTPHTASASARTHGEPVQVRNPAHFRNTSLMRAASTHLTPSRTSDEERSGPRIQP